MDVLQQKPDIDRAKIDAQRQRDQSTAEYHNNLVTLGKEKADNIKAYRDAIIDLKQQGVDQNDTRIQQAQEKIDELVRSNKAKESENIVKEQGKNERFEKGQQVKANLASAKMKFEAAMKQFQAAMGADKTAAQQNVNNARAAYLQALTQAKNGGQ
jgi:low affinity Fe/Cu permease